METKFNCQISKDDICLDFWATWCTPCRGEIPYIKEVYKKYKGKDFGIVGYSLDSEQKELEDVVKKENILWPNVFGENANQIKLDKIYAIRAIPRNFLIDPNGVIIQKNLRVEELEAELKKIFGK